MLGSESHRNCFSHLAGILLEVWLPTKKTKLMLQIVAYGDRNLTRHPFTTTAFYLKLKQENHSLLCTDAA